MPYIQKWGISRSQSPFNAFSSPLKEEDLEKKVDTNPDLSADKDIITQNNNFAEFKTQSEHGMSDSEYAKNYNEGNIHDAILDEVEIKGTSKSDPNRNLKLDTYYNWDNWKGDTKDLSDAEWYAKALFDQTKSQGEDPFSDEYKAKHDRLMKSRNPDHPEYVSAYEKNGFAPGSGDMSTHVVGNTAKPFKPTPDLSPERADQIAAQFKRQEEGDSAWDQVGTFLNNPFQGTVALGNQLSQGLRDITGNPTNISERTDSLANLTNLAMAKEYEKKSGIVHPDLEKSNMFNNATQWQPHLVAASSAHQVLTGGDQVLSGDFKEGGKNIVGGAFSYLPGVKQMRKMGGVTGVTSKFDKLTGPMIANIRPTVNKLTTNLANKIDANKTSRIASVILDKGGTYSYKINKAKNQGQMKSS